MDLAEVNGRVFVNNVSLGLYAEAVQREGYRDAKMRTMLDTVPDVLGPDGGTLDLRWTRSGRARAPLGRRVLVSNNRYRLGRAVGSGTRPRIDDGLLGDHRRRAATGAAGEGRVQRPWREWSAPDFEVDADQPVPAGIDGEALCSIRRCGSRSGPGSCACGSRAAPRRSPSAMAPEGVCDGRWSWRGSPAAAPEIPQGQQRRPEWT